MKTACELLQWIGLSLAGGLGLYLAVGGIFEVAYYRARRRSDAWRCQPGRRRSAESRRREILLGAASVTVASIASGVFAWCVWRGGCSKLYWSNGAHSVRYSIASGVAYAVVTDFTLYWGHRLLHTPFLCRAVHRVHHGFTAPTAFGATAMHPFELAMYQTMMALPLFVVPLHAGAVVATVVLAHVQAMAVHSGVALQSWLPLVVPVKFHDDHHAHFHGNFGHSLIVWDWLFGTLRGDATSSRAARRAGAGIERDGEAVAR